MRSNRIAWQQREQGRDARRARLARKAHDRTKTSGRRKGERA